MKTKSTRLLLTLALAAQLVAPIHQAKAAALGGFLVYAGLDPKNDVSQGIVLGGVVIGAFGVAFLLGPSVGEKILGAVLSESSDSAIDAVSSKLQINSSDARDLISAVSAQFEAHPEFRALQVSPAQLRSVLTADSYSDAQIESISQLVWSPVTSQ